MWVHLPLACLGGSRVIRDYPPLGNRIRAFMNEDIVEHLERRLGRLHAKQRIGIEGDHEARVFGQGLNYFHPENWYFSPAIIRNALKLTGLYWRAKKNAERIQIRHCDIVLPGLPAAFDGFTILQISDLHVDINEGAMQNLIDLLPGSAYAHCGLHAL